MNLLLLSVCTLVICASQFGSSSGSSRTHLAVYYESLCPDSKRFIVTKLNPLMQSAIGKHVDLELIPYGKAKTHNANGHYHFTCQHGNEECEGNKLHACAIKHLSHEDAIKYIACTMSMGRYVAGESCAVRSGVDYNALNNCQSSDEGTKLLAHHGDKTHSLRPTMYYVPWIVFDHHWDLDRMDRAQTDLESVVCDLIGREECAKAHKENRGSRRVRRKRNANNRRRRY